MLECLWMAYMLKFLNYLLKFLEDYEYLATWILLPIEIVFLYFVLQEFKMTRKSFERQEEAEIERRLVVIIEDLFANMLTNYLEPNKHTLKQSIIRDNKEEKQDVKNKFLGTMGFCQNIDRRFNGKLYKLTQHLLTIRFTDGTSLLDKFNSLFNSKDESDFNQNYSIVCQMFRQIHSVDKRAISYIRKKVLNDNEINEIYEKFIVDTEKI